MPVARIGREAREVLGLTMQFMQETGIPFEQMGETRMALSSRRITSDPNQGGFDFGAPAAPAATPTAQAAITDADVRRAMTGAERNRLKAAETLKERARGVLRGKAGRVQGAGVGYCLRGTAAVYWILSGSRK
ncbi:MAG: hypothetical protein DVB27_13525 [Verrucomicrobia bacterium]|jgi:hypothetical protein|nr:MAG: hypothetical protein DVB27_13525 [Verrucomicrobiota bacterium]